LSTVTRSSALAEGLPLDRFTIERCARIAASIDEAPARAGDILAASELDSALWQTLDDHWQREIDAELCLGTTALLERYDHAYVEQISSGRVRLDNEAYARLVVAAERGTIDATLDAMGLPSAALARVERVWLGRLVDALEGKAIRQAIALARKAVS
jgi:hypothetical protein